MKFLQPKLIKEKMSEIRALGFRGAVKKMGWKLIAGIVLFYLVRDTLLYIVIPYLVINNVISCE